MVKIFYGSPGKQKKLRFKEGVTNEQQKKQNCYGRYQR